MRRSIKVPLNNVCELVDYMGSGRVTGTELIRWDVPSHEWTWYVRIMGVRVVTVFRFVSNLFTLGKRYRRIDQFTNNDVMKFFSFNRRNTIHRFFAHIR